MIDPVTVVDPVTFEEWWSRPVQWVTAPNERGRGISRTGTAEAAEWPELRADGRIYVKRQTAYHCRPLWNALRLTPTLRRERRCLDYCLERGLPVPEVLAYAEGSGHRALLVVKEIPRTRGLRAALETYPSARGFILANTTRVLKELHLARVRHGALYPKHLLIGDPPGHDVWIIDFEKARVLPSRTFAARGDLEQLFRRIRFISDGEREQIRNQYIDCGILPSGALGPRVTAPAP